MTSIFKPGSIGVIGLAEERVGVSLDSQVASPSSFYVCLFGEPLGDISNAPRHPRPHSPVFPAEILSRVRAGERFSYQTKISVTCGNRTEWTAQLSLSGRRPDKGVQTVQCSATVWDVKVYNAQHCLGCKTVQCSALFGM